MDGNKIRDADVYLMIEQQRASAAMPSMLIIPHRSIIIGRYSLLLYVPIEWPFVNAIDYPSIDDDKSIRIRIDKMRMKPRDDPVNARTLANYRVKL